VPRYTPKPGAEVASPPEVAEIAKRNQKNLLRQIIDIVHVLNLRRDVASHENEAQVSHEIKAWVLTIRSEQPIFMISGCRRAA
jgi:hypothetical protein